MIKTKGALTKCKNNGYKIVGVARTLKSVQDVVLLVLVVGLCSMTKRKQKIESKEVKTSFLYYYKTFFIVFIEGFYAKNI